MNLPDAAPVIDLIEAFRRSKTMFAAVDLGIFDQLADGAKGALALAGTGSVDTMARLLDACVSLGFLEKNGDRYTNTAVTSAYLCRTSPNTMAGYISYSNRALYPMWGHLEDAVREGTHRWKQTFGLEGASLFSHFYRTDEDRREFLLGMHGFGVLISPAVVAAFDLSPYKRMVDLGGGTGHLAMAASARYPEMSVAVFDLAEAVECAREFTAGSKVELLAGDFLTGPLPEAGLYAVGRILHDWSEEKIRLLLDRIYASLPAGGGLLIAEKLLLEDLSGPVHAHMQSLNMLICTEGRERSFSQYADLLQEAGFAEIQGRLTGVGLDAILARK
ncbi:MAG: homocysteine methyltransferase [Acidobacteriia bacterium]|nr:homocysteine methyltransferase [Terriglobia bacterium]